MDEGADHDDRHDEADDEADRDRPKPTPLRAGHHVVMVLDQLERGRAEHRRDGEEEAELGRGAPLDAEQSAPMIVAPERLTPGIIARHWMKPTPTAVPSGISATPTMSGRLHQPLDHEDRDAADDQRTATIFGAAEQRLDLVDENEAEDRRGKEGDQDVADEAPRHRIALISPSSTAQKVRQ